MKILNSGPVFGSLLISVSRNEYTWPLAVMEVHVAANSSLRGMDVAEVVRAVDNPEFFVAGREVENSSFSGRMMSVEKRNFAFTGTMSFCAYFTTPAVSVAACGDLNNGQHVEQCDRESAE
jgi:hypothetical protein